MNHHTFLTNLVLIVLALYLFGPFYDIFAKAYWSNCDYQPSAEDLGYASVDYEKHWEVYYMLKRNGWIDEGISWREFDYISQLAFQFTGMTSNVRYSLALAQISVESKFVTTAYNGTALGLMQLIPSYTRDRMSYFVEEGHTIVDDDYLDARLNLATGIDYMDYILDETKGDEAYALMWYNQGAISASKEHLDYGITSSYANEVLEIADAIQQIFLA